MTNEQREELMSAYLDDELAPDQRAEVERLLAESPELRQLRDELVALSASMRSLPRHKLDRDLGRAVLERAERSVLGGTSPGDRSSDARVRLPITEWWSRGAGWRRLAWPAVAVAAALAIMVFNRDERAPERQVAQAPKGETSMAARPAARGAAKSADEERADVPSELRLLPANERLPESPPTSESAAGGAAATTMMRVGPAEEDKVKKTRDFLDVAAQPDVSATTVLEVRPEYLRDKSFEKLLTTLKVKFVVEDLRLATSLAVRRKATKSSLERLQDQYAAAPGQAGSRQVYLVEASGEQLAQIIAEMRNQSKLVDSRQEPPRETKEASSANAAGVMVIGHRFVLQAPAARPATPAKVEDQP